MTTFFPLDALAICSNLASADGCFLCRRGQTGLASSYLKATSHARSCKLPTRVKKTELALALASAAKKSSSAHHPCRELVDVGGGAGAGGRGGAHGVDPGAAGRARGRRGQVEVPQGHGAGGRAPAGQEGRARARQRGPGRNAHLRHDHVLVRHVCFRFTSGPGSSRFDGLVGGKAGDFLDRLVPPTRSTWGRDERSAASVRGPGGVCGLEMGGGWMDAKWEDCGVLIAPGWARRTCHVGSRVEPTSGPGCLAGRPQRHWCMMALLPPFRIVLFRSMQGQLTHKTALHSFAHPCYFGVSQGWERSEPPTLLRAIG